MRRCVWLLLLGLAACATPYQPMGFAGGYVDEQVGPGEYMIRFAGNGFTSMGLSYQYVMRRAGELCPGGYEVLDRMGHSEQSTVYWETRKSITAQSVSRPEIMARIRCR